ncbi:neprilysin-2-like [Ruditapes philippinarum]|uniref:neprilysin-2-like n=1 Tax=Ruditapes philippinarum TaxID=129788 RepID=UPI00295B9C82|nr:neprilysin-2-like [Ruditapes philippinarum]
MLDDRLPDVIARVFVEEHFLKKERRYILDLVDQHKEVFKDIIENAKWISDTAKTASKEKIDSMKVEVGYPKEVYNDAYLNQLHKNFKVNTDNPFQTAVSMTRAEKSNEVKLLRATPKDTM